MSPWVTKLKLHSKEHDFHEERAVETIEQALKDLAAEAKAGELPLPVTVEFDSPEGATFTITINSHEAAEEVARQGFMY
jgi:hypothetical protein